MGQHIYQQPDGNYAIFSSITDSFIDRDLTREALIAVWKAEAVKRAEELADEQLVRAFDRIEAGNNHNRFGMTYPQAVDLHNHSSSPDQRIPATPTAAADSPSS